MNDNVIQFPGQKELQGMRASQMVAKSVAKGKKVTQQQAFGALLEMRQMMDSTIGAIGRLTQTQQGFESILERIDTNLGVLMSMLIDMEVFTKEDFEAAWKKYVTDPQEANLSKHVEKLKESSAEDAFFAEVITMVRDFDWEDREVNDKTVSGKQVKDFYVQMLVNPTTRHQALVDVRKDVPGIPEMNLPKEKDVPAPPKTDTERAMPDCKYCGECDYCKSLEEEELNKADALTTQDLNAAEGGE